MRRMVQIENFVWHSSSARVQTPWSQHVDEGELCTAKP